MQNKIDHDSTFHFVGENGKRRLILVTNFLIDQNASFVVKYFKNAGNSIALNNMCNPLKA